MATPTQRSGTEFTKFIIAIYFLPIISVNIYGNSDPFVYNYDTVRMTGLILAVIMFVLGIVIALSNKCKCKQKNANGSQSDGRQPLQTQTPAGSV